MGRHDVKAGKTVLERFAERPAIDAVVELIWNALDAEADKVSVLFDRGSLGEGGAEHVTRVRVEDNGHGIEPATAVERFTSLGDSWKVGLVSRTLNGKRVLHGRQGRGRFFAYSLGYTATWDTVWEDADGNRVGFRIDGSRAAINQFSDTEPQPTKRLNTGTTVDIRVDSDKSLSSLLDDELPIRLSARFAPHLLGNSDIEIRVDGALLDPKPLIANRDPDVQLTEIAVDDLRGHPAPMLRLIEWNGHVRGEMPAVVLCNEGGAALAEFDSQSKQPVKVTGYVLWEGFESTRQDLLVAEMAFASIIDAARTRVAEYVGRRVDDLRGSIVKQLVDEQSYPYPTTPPDDPIEQAEQQLYDVMLVAARNAIGSSKRERRMTARLIQIAVQERTHDVDEIIDGVLGLPPEIRDLLRDLLRDTSLASIVRAGGEVRARIELVVGLRRLLYSADTADQMREVDQLHPLVRDQEWLFGEEWRMSRSEISLTSVLREVVPDSVMLEAELAAARGQVRRNDGKTGRVDLLLQRLFNGPSGKPERLVVELKRPSVTLNTAHVEQVRSYARALDRHQGVTNGHWTFWLVGTSFDADLLADAVQADRTWGHIDNRPNYDIFITRWSELIEAAERRLEFFRGQLELEIGQDDAARRLRERHGDLIPEIT
ncbi:MAG: ATP-binding protein [Actinomycetota bacterium]|nr:ATP-binding protein [Actinomycetota bacterium]